MNSWLGMSFSLVGNAIGYGSIVDLARIHDNFPPSCAPIRAGRFCTSGW